MGLQSFQFPVDFLNNLEKPIIYLAKQDKTIIDSVAVYDDLSITCNLNAFQTASFKIHRDIDGKKQNYFSAFEDEMLIMIPGVSWYEIHVETNIEPNGITKTVTANSLECKLCDKRLIDFECNAGEILYDDYVRTIFYDPTNPEGSLLNRVLNVSPNWTVGHVDDSLSNKQRTFDVDDTDVYSFLTGEVSEAFNCLFIFDTFNCTVNAYDLDNYGSDTNIFVSMDNLAQNMTESVEENSIFTCYRVNGGDGVYINEVNPNGTNKIYNFEYYLPQMSQEIQAKVNSYNTLFQNLKPKYEDVMLRMQTQIDVIQELYTRLPDSLSSKDWTLYGLNFLETKKKSFETMDQLYCAYGYNKSTSPSYNLYKQNLQDLKDVTAEYNVRQEEIDDATEVYNSIKEERNVIQEQLDMDNFFTVDEWKSIDNYVKEQTYTNDNYIVTDQEDDSERFEIERQLYEAAWKDLSKKCRPQYQYSATLSNILTIPEFKDFVKYFELGNFIRMETDYDTIVRLRIISFTVNYNDTKTIDVTFSDAIRVKDVYEDAASIQAQANSAAMSFQFNKDQYDKTVKQGNFVAEMRKYGLDVATTSIHNSSNQSQVWDETGMTFRQWNDERQDYEPEMAKIINNMMVFSDDSMQTVRMGIGKIFLPNGEYSYGINGETILGKLFCGEYLTLENDSGTYKFDDSGFSATNGTNTIKIQPNTSNELFSIYKGSTKQMYIDSSGNAHFKGDISGSTGTFSGLVSGGSININNTFTVDSNGNMYASSGTFGGTLNSANGTFSGTLNGVDGTFTGTLNGNNIIGATITSAYGQFSQGFSVDLTSSSSWSKRLMEFNNDGFEIILYTSISHSSFSIDGRDIKISADALNNGSIRLFGSSVSLNGKNILTENEINDKLSSYALSSHSHDYVKRAGTADKFTGDVSLSQLPSTVKTGVSKASASGTTYSSAVTSLGASGRDVTYYINPIGSSDKRLKHDIQDLKDIEKIYLNLRPVSFKFNDDLSGYTKKIQYGLIAQEVNEVFNENKITENPLVNTCEAEDIFNEKIYLDDNTKWLLDKEQFHAMHIYMIQKQQKEIDELKQEIVDLKEKINNGTE